VLGACTVAANAEDCKRAKYTQRFVPVAVETLWALGEEVTIFLWDIGCCNVTATSEPRSTHFLFQRLSRHPAWECRQCRKALYVVTAALTMCSNCSLFLMLDILKICLHTHLVTSRYYSCVQPHKACALHTSSLTWRPRALKCSLSSLCSF